MDFDVDLISTVPTYCYPEDLAMAIQQLWQDPVIPKLLDNHSSEFYLMDSAPWYVSLSLMAGNEPPGINSQTASSRKPIG